MRLIDASVFEAELWNARRSCQMMDDSQTADSIMHGLHMAEKIMKDVPVIDAAPIVHASWVREVDRYNHWHCSACKYVVGVLMRIGSDYCPHCGAVMDLPEIEGTGL